MLYEELRHRYGNHVANRVRRELSRNEFNQTTLENLPAYLEERAKKLGGNYQALMDNPFERGNVRSEILQKRWRDAEDLAYLLSIAEDVTAAVRGAIAKSG
jgi:hypothetical protein